MVAKGLDIRSLVTLHGAQDPVTHLGGPLVGGTLEQKTQPVAQVLAKSVLLMKPCRKAALAKGMLAEPGIRVPSRSKNAAVVFMFLSSP